MKKLARDTDADDDFCLSVRRFETQTLLYLLTYRQDNFL